MRLRLKLDAASLVNKGREAVASASANGPGMHGSWLACKTSLQEGQTAAKGAQQGVELSEGPLYSCFKGEGRRGK